jgi:hypothetical protein
MLMAAVRRVVLDTNEQDILQTTSLDRLWPICSTRAEALQAVKG